MNYHELANSLKFSAMIAEEVGGRINNVDLLRTAAEAIVNLFEQAEEAESRAEKSEREKDAAVNDLRIFGHCCSCCKWFNAPNCKAKEPCGTNDNWEWRGLKED
mgnify:FL=1